jgi:Straboviridae dCMP hydroxymethylase
VKRVNDVRLELAHAYLARDFVRVGDSDTIEIIGARFLADEESIFGEVNRDYVRRELEWYGSQSLNVNDIPGGAPEVWKRVATPDGRINSNYGWMIYSEANGNQYGNVYRELNADRNSRRAVMIYTRPSMHVDQRADGMQDFACTSTVQYLIRDEKLHAIVTMRSNDVVFGYKNDRAWQDHVLRQLADDVGIDPGDIIWQAGSLHVYERHFHLIEPTVELVRDNMLAIEHGIYS